MTAILFLGGWLPPFAYRAVHLDPRRRSGSSLKIALLLFVFLWVRATFPRYRYDQLMRLGWKVFLPFSLVWLVLTAGVLQFGGWRCRSAEGARIDGHLSTAPRAASCCSELVVGLGADLALHVQAAR